MAAVVEGKSPNKFYFLGSYDLGKNYGKRSLADAEDRPIERARFSHPPNDRSFTPAHSRLAKARKRDNRSLGRSCAG